jgi:hypothetical protein
VEAVYQNFTYRTEIKRKKKRFQFLYTSLNGSVPSCFIPSAFFNIRSPFYSDAAEAQIYFAFTVSSEPAWSVAKLKFSALPENRISLLEYAYLCFSDSAITAE